MRRKYLVVAHVIKPHGVIGEVSVESLTDFPERFKAGLTLYLSPPIEDTRHLTIDSVTKGPRGLIIKFKEINSREEAELISGRDLLVPIEEAVRLPKEEFWVHDIVGMEVYTISGDFLGHITEVLRTGSNDVYIVKNSKEYLIPATQEVIKDISLEKRKILVEPIPGLLE
ncbi:MAG: ribosome maturation factor RimM [Actinomycetota bacterium]|nr:ribosome maturation factor RimM [Actinomycetota bacterium]